MATETTKGASWVQKTPDVCGGDACIRHTRIPVWLLVRSQELDMSEQRIRESFDPPLSQTDLEAAWEYYRSHREEIQGNIRENEED